MLLLGAKGLRRGMKLPCQTEGSAESETFLSAQPFIWRFSMSAACRVITSPWACASRGWRAAWEPFREWASREVLLTQEGRQNWEVWKKKSFQNVRFVRGKVEK